MTRSLRTKGRSQCKVRVIVFQVCYANKRKAMTRGAKKTRDHYKRNLNWQTVWRSPSLVILLQRHQYSTITRKHRDKQVKKKKETIGTLHRIHPLCLLGPNPHSTLSEKKGQTKPKFRPLARNRWAITHIGIQRKMRSHKTFFNRPSLAHGRPRRGIRPLFWNPCLGRLALGGEFNLIIALQ